MAKKKVKAQPRRRKKKQSVPFLAWLRRLIVSSVVVVVCFIGLLFVYIYLYPSGEKKQEARAGDKPAVVSPADKRSGQRAGEREEVAAKDPRKPQVSATATKHLEIPQMLVKRKEQVIRHEGYTVSYNSDYRIANWVAYELTAAEAKSTKAERSNKFVPDPEVKGASATNEDYTRTGYDRGHLAPAGDMKWSSKAMRESFYLSNISPQKPGLNRGIWKELEEQSRLWTKENGVLWIATGPVLTDSMKRMGKNRVGVPKTFYKVICTVINDEYKGIAFLFDNRDYDKTPLKSMAIPIDSVEKMTGIDFFPALPDDVEKKMEMAVDRSSWSF